MTTYPSVDTTIRVRYAETDAHGVVSHANDLVYFEVGRGASMRAVGLDYHAMEAAGTFVVVAAGRTAHVCVGRDGRPVPMPEALRAQIAGEGA